MIQNKIVKHFKNESNFTSLPNDIIRNNQLGSDALSCYCLIKSHSDSNYDFHTREFERILGLSVDKRRLAMNILEENGLVFSIKKRLPQGKGFYYMYHVFDTIDYENNFDIAHKDSLNLDNVNLHDVNFDTLKKHNDIRITTKEEKPKEQKKTKKKERIQASPLFLEFHKKFRGRKNGADTHYTDFVNKYDDYQEIELLLNDAIDYQIELRKKEVANGQKETYWKNLSTWLNQRCWEETNPEIEEPLEIATKEIDLDPEKHKISTTPTWLIKHRADYRLTNLLDGSLLIFFFHGKLRHALKEYLRPNSTDAMQKLHAVTALEQGYELTKDNFMDYFKCDGVDINNYTFYVP